MPPARLTSSPGHRLARVARPPPPAATYRWRPSSSGSRIRESVGSTSAGGAASGRDSPGDPSRPDSASPPGAAGVAGVRPTADARVDGPEAGAGPRDGANARPRPDDGFGQRTSAPATTTYSAAAAAAAASGADPWAWVPRDAWTAAAAEAGVSAAERAAAEAAAAAGQAAAAAAAGATAPPPDGWAGPSVPITPPPPPPADAWGWDASDEAAARARLELEEDWGALGGRGGPGAPPGAAYGAARPGAPGGWGAGREDATAWSTGPVPPPPPPRWTAARPGDGRAGAGGEGGAAAEPPGGSTAPDPAGPPPDVVPLTPLEADRLLPLSPQPDQVRALNADGAALVQRLGASLLLTLACIKAPAAAAGALTAPLWWPLARAAARNRGLRRGDPPVGLWRARVLEAGWQADRLGAGGAGPPGGGTGTLRLLVGDGSGATTLVVAPYERRHGDIRVGDAAELVVLGRGGARSGGGGLRGASADPAAAFTRGFRALPEAYLPETGQWVGAGYPFVDRRAAMALSVAVEEERAAAAARESGGEGEWWEDEGEGGA